MIKLDEDHPNVQIREMNRTNNQLRVLADKAKTWAELPEAYQDMVLAELGDFSASCRTRDWVHLELFNGSKSRELARKALRERP